MYKQRVVIGCKLESDTECDWLKKEKGQSR